MEALSAPLIVHAWILTFVLYTQTHSDENNVEWKKFAAMQH